MCYMCLKDDPFKIPDFEDVSQIAYKKARAAELKELLREANDNPLCYIGDTTVERLKEEQYKISRDL